MEKTPTSPTPRLMAGLVITLAAVAFFSWYTLAQISGLRDLQTRVVDRNRRDSLLLLRIQNNLNLLAIDMRDMTTGEEPYPLATWKGQVDRLHADLTDALQREQILAPAERSPDRQHFLADALSRLWTSLDSAFALAASGHDREALNIIRTTAQASHNSVLDTVSRLLQQNIDVEQQTEARIQGIYARVERNIYIFLAGMLVSISLITLYLIYSNRRLFESLATLSGERRDLARKLITMQEEVLRSISRELHDEFGQILTAVGTMLTRAAKQNVPASFKEEVMEVREVAQKTLERVRSLSLVLHPSILDEGGLEQAIDWYIPVFEKQSGIAVEYEKTGRGAEIPDEVAIHFYRVLQEALNNVARHSGSHKAAVRVLFAPGALELEVRDYGRGLDPQAANGGRPGIGMVAMRERAALLKGEIEFQYPAGGGALVRLRAPLDAAADASAKSSTETLVQ